MTFIAYYAVWVCSLLQAAQWPTVINLYVNCSLVQICLIGNHTTSSYIYIGTFRSSYLLDNESILLILAFKFLSSLYKEISNQRWKVMVLFYI